GMCNCMKRKRRINFFPNFDKANQILITIANLTIKRKGQLGMCNCMKRKRRINFFPNFDKANQILITIANLT
ncbi:hypothetical protein EDM27_17340, partial [Staphylococcus aureus]